MPLCDRRVLGLLLVLVLSGCGVGRAAISMGMLVSPLAYLAAVALLWWIGHTWSFRQPAPSLRLPVLAIPAGVLLLSSLLLLVLVGTDSGDIGRGHITEEGCLLILLVTVPALFGLIGVLFRVWLVLDPASSIEGSALLGSMLFYAPGLILSLPLGWDNHTITNAVLLSTLVCLYASGLGMLVAPILVIEALARRHLGRSADSSTL